MHTYRESSEVVLQRHKMFQALRAASVSDRERLESRIRRLENERAYSLPGWRVAERHAALPPVLQAVPAVPLLPAPASAMRPGWTTQVRRWLSHPLIEIGKAA